MKYVFIENHRAEFSDKAMCRVLRVAHSGWYAWRLRRQQITPRQQFRLVYDTAVRKAFTKAKQRHGAPRLADELPEYNLKTIAASLRRQGLRAKAARKFSPVSYREHGLPVYENLLKQDFYASGSNQKWAGDITYLRTYEGWLYLAVIIDLWVPFSHRLVNVTANDCTTGQRCVTDGALAAKAPEKYHHAYRQRRAVLFGRLSGVAEAP